MVTRPAPAKLNLTLRVTGTRPDGFHTLESLVVQVPLADTVRVAARDDERIALKCDRPDIPADASNLAWRAAEKLRKAAGISKGADIALTKRIPAGAGLGGGSSNAATTLQLLNELWRLGWPLDRLAEIGAQVGSDVPVFLHGPLSIMRGRGEVVERLPQAYDFWAAVVLPPLHCATPAVYAAWDRLTEHPTRPALGDVRARLGAPAALMEMLFNDLEEAAFAVNPSLRELAARATNAAGQPVRLTGSGAALFSLFAERFAAQRCAAAIVRDVQVPVEVLHVTRI